MTTRPDQTDCQLTDWLTDCLTDWLTDWQSDWLTDRLTDWLTARPDQADCLFYSLFLPSCQDKDYSNLIVSYFYTEESRTRGPASSDIENDN